VGAAAGLLAFYWLGGFVYWAMTNDWYISSDWTWSTLQHAKSILAGCMVGATVAGVGAYLKRRMALINVHGDSFAGVSINMGAMPMAEGPAAVDDEPDLSGMRLPEGIGIWHESWIKSAKKLEQKGEKRGKVYVDLVVALLRVLAAHNNVPAGVASKKSLADVPPGEEEDDDDSQRAKAKVGLVEKLKAALPWIKKTAGDPERKKSLPHGGHTLLEHSYSVAFMALQAAREWKYEDAEEQWNRSERIRGTHRKIGKRNGSYVFRKSDELVPIIALAHDLGKIQTFVDKGNGEWSVDREDHDSVSAQMLMRLPEFWKIPRRERRIILLIVSTYHRDAELRRHIDHVGYEDRIFALLQLLILADKATGLIEEGRKPEMLESEADIEDEDWKPKVWAAFTQLMNQANRIGPKHNQYRIGQKNVVGKDKPIIIINEMSLRKEIEKLLPKECLRYAQTRVGSDINGLTALILETLDKYGVLIKQYGGHITSATSAVWMVEFSGRDKEKTGPIARWKYSILVDPTEKFSNLCDMVNADTTPSIQGPSGNRNEGLGFGEIGPETGIDPAIVFEDEDDDGNKSTDPDEDKVDKETAKNDRAQSSIFGPSQYDDALPESTDVANQSLAAVKGAGKKSAFRKQIKRRRVDDEAVAPSHNEFDDPVPAMQTEPESEKANEAVREAKVEESEDDVIMKCIRAFAIEATAGKVMGSVVSEDGKIVLVPYKQATKVPNGKVLCKPEVAQRIVANEFPGVSIEQMEDGVYIKLVLNE